jgi:GNAT superfamily N-acetyltransferase
LKQPANWTFANRLHRSHFEDLLKANIESFTKSIPTPASNPLSKNPPLLLVMEFKKAPIGCIFLQPTASANQKVAYKIAHFHVDAPYRRTGVGKDLLSRAIKDSERSKGDIAGVTTRLTPYTEECLKMAGFARDDGAVRVFDQITEKVMGSDTQKVLFVDTQRTGWMLRR